jgi:hypothetical protein
MPTAGAFTFSAKATTLHWSFWQEGKMSYPDKRRFGGILSVCTGVGVTAMLAGPSTALDRLLSLGGIDLMPLSPETVRRTCDWVKTQDDVKRLDLRRQTVLNIQQSLKKVHEAREASVKAAEDQVSAHIDPILTLRYRIANLKNNPGLDASALTRAETTLRQEEQAKAQAEKAREAAITAVVEAQTAEETVNEQLPVVLRCIDYRLARLQQEDKDAAAAIAAISRTCTETDYGSYPCEVRRTAADGSFEISSPGKATYTFEMIKPGVASVWANFGERNTALPGNFSMSVADLVCWTSDATPAKICYSK